MFVTFLFVLSILYSIIFMLGGVGLAREGRTVGRSASILFVIALSYIITYLIV